MCGYGLQKRIPLFQRFFIPAPLIGGIIGSLITTWLRRQYGLTADYSILPVFVAGFFASIGLRVNVGTIRKGLPLLLLFLAITVIVAFGQNVLSYLFIRVMHLNYQLTAIYGSLGLIGDQSVLNTVPFLKKQGGFDLPLLVGYSNFGDIVATILGGLFYYFLKTKKELTDHIAIQVSEFSPAEFTKVVFVFLAAVSVGLIPSELGLSFWLNPAGGGFLAGIIISVLLNQMRMGISSEKINTIGNFSLSMLLTISFITVDLSAIKNTDVLGLIIFFIQAGWLIMFCYFVVLKLFKANTLGAYVASGLIGFSLGMPASTMSTLQCLTELEGASPLVLFIVPPVGAWLISIINPYIIRLFA